MRLIVKNMPPTPIERSVHKTFLAHISMGQGLKFE